MNSRLTKRHRLLNSRDFSQVFAQPAFRFSSPQLLLLAQPNATDRARLGVVVSRKHLASAVARNRIKRLCREAFRVRADEFVTIDIVILARGGLDSLDNSAVNALLNRLFDKLREAAVRHRSGAPSQP